MIMSNLRIVINNDRDNTKEIGMSATKDVVKIKVLASIMKISADKVNQNNDTFSIEDDNYLIFSKDEAKYTENREKIKKATITLTSGQYTVIPL